MTAPRIALLGLFGSPNLGNEATLAAFLHHVRLRLPEAEVRSLAPAGSAVQAMHGLELIPLDPAPATGPFWRLARWPSLQRRAVSLAQRLTESGRSARATELLRGTTRLIVPGTGVADDFGQGPQALPAHVWRWCGAASRAGIPVEFVSVGAEPVRHPLARRYLSSALASARYRSFRDEEARRHAALLLPGASADPVVPDLAFSLPAEVLGAAPPVAWPPRRIGVGVMGYFGWNAAPDEGERIYLAYRARLERFIAWLLERGHSVRLLPGDTRADARPLRELSERFGASENPAARVVAQPVATFQDLLRQLAEVDLLVATRYHNVLLSLMLERPAVSVGYSGKNDALMASAGLSAWCQSIERLDEALLQRQFEQLAGLPEPPLAPVRAVNVAFRRQLDAQYDRLFPRGG